MELKYKYQVQLLLRILPEIAREKDLALHGGTAINLFYHDMPRLSVDIDLTYLPFGDRENDLKQIQVLLKQIKERLLKKIPGMSVKAPIKNGDDLKLFCSLDGTLVKIEVNTINRGIIGEPKIKVLCQKSQDTFNSFCEIQIVPEGQLFGGKIVAALDRQHPRDLFDVSMMIENIGYTDQIHNGFLFCLLSSKRPFHEILRPSFIDQRQVLESQFLGMIEGVFSYEMFELTRNQLIETIGNRLKSEDKNLLMDFASGEPKWGGTDFSEFPGVKWKLLNINKFKKNDPEKFRLHLNKLEDILFNYTFQGVN